MKLRIHPKSSLHFYTSNNLVDFKCTPGQVLMNTSYGRHTQQKNSNTKWSVYKGSSAHRFFEPCWDSGIHMNAQLNQIYLGQKNQSEFENLFFINNTKCNKYKTVISRLNSQ